MLNENSCGAVIFYKNSVIKYLLLKYEAGHWDFVKGNIEKNETEKQTVLRELEEETGIVDAYFIEGFKEKIAYFYKRQAISIYKEVKFFLMEVKTINVQLSFEHVGYDWLCYEEALKRLTFNNAKAVLEKAQKFLAEKDAFSVFI